MPEELKRDIQQLSVEKDQLIVKIKGMLLLYVYEQYLVSALKHRTTGDAEFNAIFDVTSRLRHEQEEEVTGWRIRWSGDGNYRSGAVG